MDADHPVTKEIVQIVKRYVPDAEIQRRSLAGPGQHLLRFKRTDADVNLTRFTTDLAAVGASLSQDFNSKIPVFAVTYTINPDTSRPSVTPAPALRPCGDFLKNLVLAVVFICLAWIWADAGEDMIPFLGRARQTSGPSSGL